MFAPFTKEDISDFIKDKKEVDRIVRMTYKFNLFLFSVLIFMIIYLMLFYIKYSFLHKNLFTF
jgi:hypothetical protein